MSLSNWHFYFHLTPSGWTTSPPRHEDAAPDAPPANRLMTLLMIEYNADNRSDIWHKPKVIFADQDANRILELLEKFHLPKVVTANCPFAEEELQQDLAKRKV